MIPFPERREYPAEYDTKPKYCPVCGEECGEYVWSKYYNEIIGCDECTCKKELWEIDDDDI